MEAPAGIKWGSVVIGGNTLEGKIGIYVSVKESTKTNVKFHVEVWFATKYSCRDKTITLKFNSGENVSSASTTVVTSKPINHTDDTGLGWGSKNQTQLYEYDSTTGYDRRHTDRVIKFYASLSGIDMLNKTMHASTSYTILKKDSYKITFSANGGSGAPSSQTKWYGETLKLSSTKPTRTGYTFKGWSTSSTATSATYSAGGSYTDNKAATLYAVWTLAYIKPRITNFSVRRVNQNGQNDDQGTICNVIFNWATDNPMTADNPVTAIIVSYRQVITDAPWSDIRLPAEGTSGSVSQNLSPVFSIENSYEIKVTVSDGDGSSYSSYATRTLPSAKFLIDFRAGGDGIAIGQAAENPGFEVYMDANFKKGLFNNGEKVVLESDLATSNITLSVYNDPNSNVPRLRNLNYTAKYVPVIPAVFVRIYGVINDDMDADKDYDIINITSNGPNWRTALSVKSAKHIVAEAKSSAITIRPLEANAKNYEVYIAGFWFV